MRRTLIFAAVILGLALGAGPAAANTAEEALNAPYDTHALFRAPGVPNPDIWNSPVDAVQPNVDPDSPALARAFSREVGFDPDTGALDENNLPGNIGYFIYIADAATEYKKACSYFVLRGTDWPWNRSAHDRTVTEGVPVPTGDLQYDGGGDHAMAIYQPSTGYYAEFFDGLTAAPAGTVDPEGRKCDYLYGGAAITSHINQVPGQPWYDSSPGYFRAYGVFPDHPADNEEMVWGRQAAGAMPVIGGVITSAEFNHPSDTDGFGHTLAVNVRAAACTAPWWPAQRNDCASGTLTEGALFRFAPDTDCSIHDAEINDPSRSDADRLWLTRSKAFCTTGKKYGFRVVDQTGSQFAYHVAWGHGTWTPDGGSLDGGVRYPHEYMRPFADAWAKKIQVMAESPHPVEWSPGCKC